MEYGYADGVGLQKPNAETTARYPLQQPRRRHGVEDVERHADERAGAPTMLLDRASRAPTPQRQKPSAKAPAFPRLGWLVLAAAAVFVLAYFWARSR